jgi:hypothetical protein
LRGAFENLRDLAVAQGVDGENVHGGCLLRTWQVGQRVDRALENVRGSK